MELSDLVALASVSLSGFLVKTHCLQQSEQKNPQKRGKQEPAILCELVVGRQCALSSVVSNQFHARVISVRIHQLVAINSSARFQTEPRIPQCQNIICSDFQSFWATPGKYNLLDHLVYQYLLLTVCIPGEHIAGLTNMQYNQPVILRKIQKNPFLRGK